MSKDLSRQLSGIKNSKMDNQSLAYNTLKNSTYGFLGYFLPILFTVLVVPVIIGRLGLGDYGAFVFVNTVTAMVGLLDLGFTVTLIKYASQHYAEKDFVQLTKLFHAGNALYLIIGLLGLAIFFVVGKFFLPFFNFQGATADHILIVFLIAGLVFFVNAINSSFTIVPHALQRFDIHTKLSVAQLVVSQTAVLIAVSLGYKLKVIMLIQLVSAVAVSLGYIYYSRKILPEVNIWGISFEKIKIKLILKFSGFAALINLASSSLLQFDRLVIPAMLGPAALSFYSVPGSIVTKIPGTISSFSGIFFPLTSSLQSQGDMQTVRHIYRRAFRNFTLLAAIMTTTVLVFSHKILLFWLGPEFAEKSASVLVVLALTHFVLSLYAPLSNFLFGLGKLKILAVSAAVMAIVNLISLFILVPRFGILGAAWAYLIGVLPLLFVFFWVEKRALNFNDTLGFYLKLYGKIAFTAAVSYFVGVYILDRFAVNLASLLVVAALFGLGFLLLYKAFGFFELEDWDLFKSFGSSVLKRFKVI